MRRDRDAAQFEVATPLADAIHAEVDDYHSLGWAMAADGTLRIFRVNSGEVIDQRRLFEDAAPTAWSFGVGGREAVCGFADGTVRTVRIGFSATYPDEAQLPDELRGIDTSHTAAYQGGLIMRTKQGQLRLQSVRATVGNPVPSFEDTSGIERVDSSARPSGRVTCILDSAGQLSVHAERRRQSLLGESSAASAIHAKVRYSPPADHGLPDYLLLAGQADNLYLIWKDGLGLRYDLRDLDQPRLAEQLDFLPADGALITAVRFLPGKTTLAIGDSSGRVRAWFPVRAADARTADGITLVAAPAGGPGPPFRRWPRRPVRGCWPPVTLTAVCASSMSPVTAPWSKANRAARSL